MLAFRVWRSWRFQFSAGSLSFLVLKEIGSSFSPSWQRLFGSVRGGSAGSGALRLEFRGSPRSAA